MRYIGRTRRGEIFKLIIKKPITKCGHCPKRYTLEDADVVICEPLGLAIENLEKIHEKCPLLEE